MNKTISHVIDWPSRTLDRLGMYRVVTLGLLFLVGASLALSLVGYSAYTFSEQIVSLTAVIVAGMSANEIVARLFKVKPNRESALITTLILFFLFTPSYDLVGHYLIGLAAVAAMLSKYIFVFKKQHVFNAAAFGAVALSLSGLQEAWWWIASPEMFIPLMLAGAAVVYKVRRWSMAVACVTSAFFVTVVHSGGFDLSLLERFFVTGPVLFMVFFMLTEPFTAPPTTKLRLFYGAFIGALASTTIFSSYFGMTPELALVIGNVAFWPTTLRQKLFLEFVEKREIANNTFEFLFKKPQGMHFQPGQYLEWMVPHQKPDTRGVRRYFTIASSPEEEELRLSLRVDPNKGSSYKRELIDLKPGEKIVASQLAGDFLLPTSDNQKIAMVAGGIGVTPFRSHLGHLMAAKEKRDTVLFYCNNFAKDVAYTEFFAEVSEAIDLNFVSVLSKEEVEGHENGYLTKEIIEKHSPDYLERLWFISGPPPMVSAYSKLLLSLGVPRRHIKTDFFPGLA